MFSTFRNNQKVRRPTPLGENKYSLHIYHGCARVAHLEKKIIHGKWPKKNPCTFTHVWQIQSKKIIHYMFSTFRHNQKMRRPTLLGEKKYSLHVYHFCALQRIQKKKLSAGNGEKKYSLHIYSRLAHLVEKNVSTTCLAHLGTIRK